MSKEKFSLTIVTRHDGLLEANRRRLRKNPNQYDSTAVEVFNAHAAILDFLEGQLAGQSFTDSAQLMTQLSQWPEFAKQRIDPEVLFLFNSMTISEDGKFIYCGPTLSGNFIVGLIVKQLAEADN